MYAWIDKKGKQHEFDTLEGAQRAYFVNGKGGTIVSLEGNGPDVDLCAVIVGYEDDEANLTTTNASWYDDADHAHDVHGWVIDNPKAPDHHRPDAKLFDGFSIAMSTVKGSDDPIGLVVPTSVVGITMDSLRGDDDDGHTIMTGGQGVVSDVAAQRIARHEAELAKIGIALAPPIYAPGSRVNSWGRANFATSRVKWENQPETSESLRSLSATIKAEQRRDVLVEASDIHMLDDGHLRIAGEGTFPLEANGLKGVLSVMRKGQAYLDDNPERAHGSIFPRGFSLMSEMDPDMRAYVFNTMLKGRGKGVDQTMRLRLRTYGNTEQIFAIRGERYSPYDGDAVADTLADVFDGMGTRGEVVYNSETTGLRVEALYHADKVVDLAAGDVFKAGFTLRSNDSGGGSIHGMASAWRNLCLNLFIIGVGNVDLFRIRHIGDMHKVQHQIKRGMERAKHMFNMFATEWGVIRETNVSNVKLWGTDFNNVEDALTWAVEHKKIEASIKRDTLTQILLTSWQEEPGNSLADIVNAVTRAAHSKLLDDCSRDILQRKAGELVPAFVKVAEA